MQNPIYLPAILSAFVLYQIQHTALDNDRPRALEIAKQTHTRDTYRSSAPVQTIGSNIAIPTQPQRWVF
jgi:hypothetical protein